MGEPQIHNHLISCSSGGRDHSPSGASLEIHQKQSFFLLRDSRASAKIVCMARGNVTLARWAPSLVSRLNTLITSTPRFNAAGDFRVRFFFPTIPERSLALRRAKRVREYRRIKGRELYDSFLHLSVTINRRGHYITEARDVWELWGDSFYNMTPQCPQLFE